MFKSLKYDARFATGRELSQDFTFDTGLTAIFGANESGKSFSLEMLRFCLFGSSALRGTAETFDKLSAECCFTVRKEAYRVERTLKKATLYRGEEVVATGTTPVNEKIVGIMGFSLQVFDIACAANQDDLHAIIKMRPTERRRMVDNTIGIGMLEAVAKWAKDEASLNQKHLNSLKDALVEPVAPVRPEGYVESSILSKQLEEAQTLASELNRIEGWLSSEMAAPKEPTCTVTLPASALEPLAKERRKNRETLAQLEVKLSSLPEKVEFTLADIEAKRQQLVAYGAWVKARDFMQRNPRPQIKRDELPVLAKAWGEFKRWEIEQDQLASLKRKLDKLTAGRIECPECSHKWHPSDEAEIKALTVQIAEMEAQPAVTRPDVPVADIRAAESFYNQWTDEDWAQRSAAPETADPGVTEVDLRRMEHQLELVKSRAGVVEEVQMLKDLLEGPDLEQQFYERQNYEQALVEYEKHAADFIAWKKERVLKQERASEIREGASKVTELSQRLFAAKHFETQEQVYLEKRDQYARQLGQITDTQKEVDQYKLIAEAMQVLRTRVKQYLIPSLNRVASDLLARMTAGSRNIVAVDEDFNIMVDGQPVETLSGSGKACVSLALRIGLGRVLVQNTFSVFLADEIDGSMDPIRATETAATLRNLSKVISQVLVISHKSVEADHEIQIGALYEPSTNPGSLQGTPG